MASVKKKIKKTSVRTKKLPKIAEPKIQQSVEAPVAAQTKKISLGGRQIALIILLLSVGIIAYNVIDKFTAWGNTPVLISRVIDAAEKNTIYKKYAQAERQYKGLIDRWSSRKEYMEYVKQARLNLARVYKDSEKYMDAIALYRELVTENKENKDMYAWLLLELGECMSSILDTDGALKAYKTIIKEYAGTDWAAEAMYGTAEAYRQKKDFANALNYYTLIVQKYQKGFLSAEAMTAIGKMYEEQGRNKMAYDVYSKVIKNYPDIVTDFAKSRIEILELKIKK